MELNSSFICKVDCKDLKKAIKTIKKLTKALSRVSKAANSACETIDKLKQSMPVEMQTQIVSEE